MTVLRSRRDKLDIDVRKYELHMRQFETARSEVKKIEKNLEVGECLIYRDFVNQYTPDGKMVNLVLVVMWRTSPGAELNVLKINHFCSDHQTNGATSFFVADVMHR